MAISEQRQMAWDKRANQVMAILLPLVEAAGIGYATYVLIYLICIQYLMEPSADLPLTRRNGTGIALIVVYCFLLLIFAATFLRLLQVIWVNPGVVSLGDKSSEKQTASTSYFDRLDAYICDYQGSPLWCEKCHNFKPDRTHHSSQLGRCVRRMDHYCPYAGGIVSETSYKFFVQFLFYGSLYTGFVLVVFSVFLAERRKLLDSMPPTWIVAVALAALFFLFTAGMFLTTFYNMAVNYTTIETMQKGSVYNIALRGRSSPPGTITSKQSGILCEVQRSASRSFIVLQTQPGDNPWDMGFRKNVCDMMGHTVVDWLVPWKMSPFTAHKNPAGEFGWGSVVTSMMEEYGAGSAYGRTSRSRSKRRRGSRNGTAHV